MPTPIPTMAKLGPVACDVVSWVVTAAGAADSCALATRGRTVAATSAAALRENRERFMVEVSFVKRELCNR